jgi:ethanolamine transporter EutH
VLKHRKTCGMLSKKGTGKRTRGGGQAVGPIEMAIVAGAGAHVAAPLAKDLLGKLLGPSAELLGDKLRENLREIEGQSP